MVLRHEQITDERLEALRARIGTYNRPSFYGVGQFNEFAGRDAIRHFCQGIGDANPLYLDEEYGRKTKYGSIIAPPCFLYAVYWCSGRVGGLPGVHGFHSGSDWDIQKTIYVNDRISLKEQFVDVVEKQSKYAKRTIITYSVTTYRNQRAEVIAGTKGWSIWAERTAAKDTGKYLRIEPAKYTPEELRAIEEAVLAEEVRGANPRFWEDVSEGDELQPVVKGPLSHGDITAFVAGAIGGISHGIALREFRKHPAWMYRDEKTGAAEAVVRVHDVADTAQEIAIPGAYDYGCQRISWLGHLMTNWIGDDGFLKVLYGELRRFNVIGDTQWCKGKVTRKYVEGAEHLVDLDIWAVNQRGETTAPGHATAVLPSKTDSM